MEDPKWAFASSRGLQPNAFTPAAGFAVEALLLVWTGLVRNWLSLRPGPTMISD
jgi:hypothetical protein